MEIVQKGSNLLIPAICLFGLLASVYVAVNWPSLDQMFTAMDAQKAPTVLTIEDLERKASFTPIAEGTLGPRAGEIVPIPGYGSALLSQDAQRQHGAGALMARLALMAGGGRRFDCGDDDVWMAKPMEGDEVACMHLVEGTEVSAFVTLGWDAALAAFRLIGCSSGTGGPGASGAVLAN